MATTSLSGTVAAPGNKIRNILPGPINSTLYTLFLIPFAAVFPLYYLSMDGDKRDNQEYYTALEPLPGLGSGRFLTSLIVSPFYFMLFLAQIAIVSGPPLLSFYSGGLFGFTITEYMFITVMLGFPIIIGGLIAIGGNLHLWSSGTDLTGRLVLTLIPALLFGGFIAFNLPQMHVAGVQIAGIAIGSMIFYIGLVTNGYIIKTDDILENKTSQSADEQFGDLYIDPDKGNEVTDSKGEDMIKTIEEENWDAPDELFARAEIISTNAFQPLRVITRVLQSNDTKESKDVSKPTYVDNKRDLRTDIRDLGNNAPDGFSKDTLWYLIPDSVDPYQCQTCHGEGHTTCPDCRGQGKQQCGRCSGNQIETCQKCGTAGKLTCSKCGGGGEQTCSSCNGSQIVRKSVPCGVCNGSGKAKDSNFRCKNCSGHGSIKKDRPCSTCSDGTVSCSKCNGTGSVRCFNCQGKAGSPCKKCNGTGTVDCSTCSTQGRVTCDNCAGTGTRVSYEVVKREYKPIEKTNYRTKSIPEQVISKADGEVEKIETTEDTDKTSIYRKQVEIQSIPVVATRYKYKGNLWEAFTVNGMLKTVALPRDFDSQFGVVCGLAFLTVALVIILYGTLYSGASGIL